MQLKGYVQARHVITETGICDLQDRCMQYKLGSYKFFVPDRDWLFCSVRHPMGMPAVS